MLVRIGDPIQLETQHGQFYARHIGISEAERLSLEPITLGGITELLEGSKEGVLITKSRNPYNDPQPHLVRVQSSCLFSESFWATDCDCSSQLSMALSIIQSKSGILIYLYEEGRGIGLRRKIEAIRLEQIEGRTTSNAFACLGLGPDPRDFAVGAATIIQTLGRDAPVELLSNSEYKARQLRQHGVNIVKRTTLIAADLTQLQKKYLASKRDDLGHDIPPEIK